LVESPTVFVIEIGCEEILRAQSDTELIARKREDAGEFVLAGCIDYGSYSKDFQASPTEDQHG
jgi:hypothetical protein